MPFGQNCTVIRFDATDNQPALIVKLFNTPVAYSDSLQAMQAFTQTRNKETIDELWLLEHVDVLTQGQAGKPEHILINPNALPIVQSDRGGQVTWHGKGQLVGYLLFDLNRLGWNVRDLVSHTEKILINVLKQYNITAYSKCEAPGVYVKSPTEIEQKIGSLGFKIRKGCSYHGFSLNIDCHLAGFTCINPCGYAGLSVTTLKNLQAELPNKPEIIQKILIQTNLVRQKNVQS